MTNIYSPAFKVAQGPYQEYVQPNEQQEENYYWYFCPDANNFYPYVKKCPRGWLRVFPAKTPPDWKE